MKQMMERLLALQKLQLNSKPLTREHETEILHLREQVASPILGHFEFAGRLISTIPPFR